MAHACPDARIVLGHGGGPLGYGPYAGKRDEVFRSWKAQLTELAGLWRPYIETGIELFGPSRCLVESNFPVDKMGIGWAAYWNALKRITAGASPAEKQAMFSGTARRVYRLT